MFPQCTLHIKIYSHCAYEYETGSKLVTYFFMVLLIVLFHTYPILVSNLQFLFLSLKFPQWSNKYFLLNLDLFYFPFFIQRVGDKNLSARLMLSNHRSLWTPATQEDLHTCFRLFKYLNTPFIITATRSRQVLYLSRTTSTFVQFNFSELFLEYVGLIIHL